MVFAKDLHSIGSNNNIAGGNGSNGALMMMTPISATASQAAPCGSLVGLSQAAMELQYVMANLGLKARLDQTTYDASTGVGAKPKKQPQGSTTGAPTPSGSNPGTNGQVFAIPSGPRAAPFRTLYNYYIYKYLTMMPQCVASLQQARGDPSPDVIGTKQPLADTIIMAMHHIDGKTIGGLCVLRELGATTQYGVFIGYDPIEIPIYFGDFDHTGDGCDPLPTEAMQATILQMTGTSMFGDGTYQLAPEQRFATPLPSAALNSSFLKGRSGKAMTFEQANRALGGFVLLRAFAEALTTGKRVIIFEDGGYLNPIVDEAIDKHMSLSVKEFRALHGIPAEDETDAALPRMMADVVAQAMVGTCELTRNGYDATRALYERRRAESEDPNNGSGSFGPISHTSGNGGNSGRNTPTGAQCADDMCSTTSVHDAAAAGGTLSRKNSGVGALGSGYVNTRFFSIAASHLKIMIEGDNITLACLNGLNQVLFSRGWSLSDRNVCVMGSRGNLGRRFCTHVRSALGPRYKDALVGFDMKLGWPAPGPLDTPQWQTPWNAPNTDCGAEYIDFKAIPLAQRRALDVIFGFTGGPTTDVSDPRVRYGTYGGDDFADWLVNGTKPVLFLASGSTKTSEFEDVLTFLAYLLKLPTRLRKVNGVPVDLEVAPIPDVLTLAAVEAAGLDTSKITRNFGTQYAFRLHMPGAPRPVVKVLYLVNNTMPVNFLWYGTPDEIIDFTFSQVTSATARLSALYKEKQDALLPGMYPTDYVRAGTTGVYMSERLTKDYNSPPSSGVPSHGQYTPATSASDAVQRSSKLWV